MALYSLSELYQTLREINYIPLAKLDQAFKDSKKRGIPIEDYLLEKDLISDTNLGQVIAEMINYPFIDLGDVAINEETFQLIPEVYARAESIVAFKHDRVGLHLATTDPSDVKAAKFVANKTGIPVKVYYTTKRSLDETLGKYAKDVGEVFESIIKESIKEAKDIKKPEPSIVKIVDTIITYAYRNKASDVHIEPGEKNSIVRFRVDGIMHDIVTIPT